MTQMKNIYFAGGCFWGTQHFFSQVDGVKEAVCGYANGNTVNPKYEEVYTDASNTLLAKLYCIDAIELIHTVLREVEVYNASKVAMQMLYKNQNSNDQQEEEAHENPVQEV